MSSTRPPPKRFLNDPNNAVSEFISGLLIQYPTKLVKLANHNVLLSSSFNSSESSSPRVHILSGGGSGHEPSHAGWIASKGMLSGAIIGGIFASPPVASILAAIRAVTNNSSGGCLLIVKNYTGDRLNFGTACELANAEGRNCKMVIVADDVAISRSKGVTGARGVAGTVWVHKIAGAAARAGWDLDDIVSVATSVAARIKSLGVALNAVTVPGATAVNDRLTPGSVGGRNVMEIGMGIHGEEGIRQSDLLNADEIAKVMVTSILEYGRVDNTTREKIVPTFEEGDELAILVNNLGGVSCFEMSILTNSIVKFLEGNGAGMKCQVSRVYVGSFMTSFDMQGASLSIMSLNGVSDIVKEFLDENTDALAWAKVDVWKDYKQGLRPSASELSEVEVPEAEACSSFDSVNVNIEDFSNVATAAIKAACESLIDSEPLLTKYDTVVGDGDCGTTMKRGAMAVLSRLESGKLDTSQPVSLFSSLADAVSTSMGGTSGALLELMFRKMSTFFSGKTSIDAEVVVAAFNEGVNAMSFYGGASVGSRTMMDALFPAAEALSKSNDLQMAATRANVGANETAKMTSASAGRSNYLKGETLDGTPDPGATAVSIVLSAIAKVI